MSRPRNYWRYKQPEKPPEPQPDILQKFFLNPAFVIALFTALLYFHGQALYSGYLSYWGLSAKLLPLSFEETLSYGAQAYIWLGIDHWKYIAWLLVYCLLIYGLVFLALFEKPVTYIYNLTQTKRINEGQKNTIGEAFDRLAHFALALVIILVILAVMFFAAQKGKALAEVEYLKLKSATSTVVTVSYLDESSQPAEVSGTLIQPSSIMIALYTENDAILELPVSRVISISQQAPKIVQVILSR